MESVQYSWRFTFHRRYPASIAGIEILRVLKGLEVAKRFVAFIDRVSAKPQSLLAGIVAALTMLSSADGLPLSVGRANLAGRYSPPERHHEETRTARLRVRNAGSSRRRPGRRQERPHRHLEVDRRRQRRQGKGKGGEDRKSVV